MASGASLRGTSPGYPSSTLLQMLEELFVFKADFVDKLCVDNNALLQRDGPGLGVGFGIIDGDLDFEVSEVRAANLFPHFGRFGHHTSVPIDPRVVAQTDRVDHQSIAGPFRR